ncbi:MAG TPA: SGNH/GDSL hydrolase family protein, partial [Candidatus Obscuribacterales bacterium]
CGLLLANPFKHVDPNAIPAARSWAWWTTQEYFQSPEVPNIVLLGSSMLMNPLWMNEAVFLNRSIDIVTHRRVQYLEAQLAKKLEGAEPVAFNFALPGAMIPDDYMVVRCLFIQSRKPRIAILGLSALDVIDSDFFCPAASNHFKYLQRFTPIDDLVELAMPHPWQRFEYYVHQMVYLAGRKHDLQVISGECAKQNLAPMLKDVLVTSAKEKKDSTQAIYQSDIEAGQWLAHPVPYDNFQDNSAGFRRHNCLLPASTFDRRLKWMSMCLTQLREKNVQPLVVNMPFAPPCLKAFPPGLRERAVQAMREEAEKHGCPFVDLQASGIFDVSDFTDVCHMDASGGKKLLDALASEIAATRQLREALTGDGSKLAETRRGSI